MTANTDSAPLPLSYEVFNVCVGSVSSSLCRPPLSSQCIIVLSSTWSSNLCLSLCTCASLPDQNPALPRQLFKVLVSSTGLPLTMGRVSPYPAPMEF
ncbi:hypothetical protein E2C01_068476 [Portunus trituberculatus]|uniref:Uncharacterized protein n=1 Tax=Portunus trituberculatus TaxID=210409 RepID=A0A5B7HZJ0_PORTR|nr:hypothetical protein [Portunus trituberculatus]